MPLKPLKEGATQEEVNAWIIESSQSFSTLETELEEKKKREKQLEEHNQKLFLKITGKAEEEKKDEETIPDFMDKDTFALLDKNDKNLLKEIIEEE